MPNTGKMQWPYPARDVGDWFQEFESMVQAIDADGYAAREDRNIIFSGGGDVTWDAGNDLLTWANDIVLYSLIAGFRLSVAAGSITLLDGEVLYVNVTRAPQQQATLSVASASNVPNTTAALALAVRSGSTVYWRWGSKIDNGETLNLFGVPGTGNASDVYERSAVFTVPVGAYADEVTLGRIAVNGSLIGLSAEITNPVTGGTVTANVKINGVVKLSVQLSLADPTLKQTVVAPGTHQVMSADQVSVEVVGASYANVGSTDAGLTVNVVLSAGISLPLGGVPNASSTTKGITRLSVDPVSDVVPIAVGDNDPRLVQSRRIIRTISQPADGSSFSVTFSPAMPSANYIVTHGLGTVSAHVTVSVPMASRLVGQFSVVTSAALTDGDTLYFHVIEV